MGPVILCALTTHQTLVLLLCELRILGCVIGFRLSKFNSNALSLKGEVAFHLLIFPELRYLKLFALVLDYAGERTLLCQRDVSC
jgi:hypothetical protein